jgi:orotidine-5'-phosphate decarboxylase
MNVDRRTGLILALDMDYETRALELVADVYAHVDAIKIGYVLILSEGLSVMKVIKRKFPQLPIIADLKVADAPHIARKMTLLALDAGADVVSVCGICGPTVIQECLQLTEYRKKNLLVFLEFTQLDGLIGPEQANRMALMAKEKGVWGILAPGTKPHRIKELRSLVGQGLVIISCGIGAQGTEPGTALRAGADFEIVGRQICTAPDSKVAAANISNSLSAIIKSKV